MPRPELPAELVWPTTVDLATAHTMLANGKFDLVTMDVFDTLVWRPVNTPGDLFIKVGAALLELGLGFQQSRPTDFRTARSMAEERAREQAFFRWGAGECTIEEIWDELDAKWWPNGDRDRGIAVELTVEGDMLRPKPTGVALLNAARAAAVPVALVSDMYLSASQLRSVLTMVDLDGVEVFTSADTRTNKWEGRLKQVISGRHVAAARVLHVGDNPLADVVTAHRLGAAAVHLDILGRDDATAPLEMVWDAYSSVTGTDGGRRAVIAETLIDAGELATDPSYQFGVAAAGPIMAGMAQWASRTTAELGASHLHCLLREGGRIASLIDIIDPDGPERILVHASRWAIMRAAVFSGTPNELHRALARRGPVTAQHIGAAFGLAPASVAAVIGADIVPADRQAHAYRALASNDAIREQICAASSALRANVLTYLRSRLVLDDEPLVLCDIGWGGTIQEGLTELLRHDGYDGDIVGLYALLSVPGERRRAEGADLRSYLPASDVSPQAKRWATLANRHPEFLERINTPRCGTLLGFEADGTPVTQPDDHDAMEPSLLIAQRGVTDFCHQLKSLVLDDDPTGELAATWYGDNGFATAALQSFAQLITRPTPGLSAALSTWEHDDVAGANAEALLSDEFRRWAPYLNAADAAQLAMNQVYWVQGAPDPTIGPLVELVRDGVAPDDVAPRSPVGRALVAVFAPGNTDAIDQVAVVPRQSARGAMIVRFETAVAAKVGTGGGVRSIRFDPGERACVIDVLDARVVVHTANESVVLADSAIDLCRVGDWQAGRWLAPGASQAWVEPGGHLLIELAADLAARVHGVEFVVAFAAMPVPNSPSGPFPEPVDRIVSGALVLARSAARAVRGGWKR